MKFYLTHHVCISGNIYVKDIPDDRCRVDENGDLVVDEADDMMDDSFSYYGKGSWFLSSDEALIDAQRRKTEAIQRLESKLETFKALNIKFLGSGT
jgi:hypothetical protein